MQYFRRGNADQKPQLLPSLFQVKVAVIQIIKMSLSLPHTPTLTLSCRLVYHTVKKLNHDFFFFMTMLLRACVMLQVFNKVKGRNMTYSQLWTANRTWVLMFQPRNTQWHWTASSSSSWSGCSCNRYVKEAKYMKVGVCALYNFNYGPN